MPDTFHLNPDSVLTVQFWHEPPGREHVRITVEYVTGKMKVLIVQKSLLAVMRHGGWSITQKAPPTGNLR